MFPLLFMPLYEPVVLNNEVKFEITLLLAPKEAEPAPVFEIKKRAPLVVVEEIEAKVFPFTDKFAKEHVLLKMP